MFRGIDAVSNVWLVHNILLLREVSDWSIVKISILPHSLTRSGGEYLRVVGIHSDGCIDREIYLVYYPFQIKLLTVTKHFLTLKPWNGLIDCRAFNWLS